MLGRRQFGMALLLCWLGLGAAGAAVDTAGGGDARITEQVQLKLRQQAGFAGDGIRVATSNGIVHLQGRVPSTDAARRAVDLAKATRGVRGVWVDFVADH